MEKMSKNLLGIHEEKSLFQVFYLKNDYNRSVEVEEVKDIDFEEVKRHLEQGDAVFITRKCIHRSRELKPKRRIHKRHKIARKTSVHSESLFSPFSSHH